MLEAIRKNFETEDLGGCSPRRFGLEFARDPWKRWFFQTSSYVWAMKKKQGPLVVVLGLAFWRYLPSYVGRMGLFHTKYGSLLATTRIMESARDWEVHVKICHIEIIGRTLVWFSQWQTFNFYLGLQIFSRKNNGEMFISWSFGWVSGRSYLKQINRLCEEYYRREDMWAVFHILRL